MPRPHGRRVRALAFAAGLCALAMGALSPAPALASSHREALLIAEDPLADPTDVYAFRSPDRPDTVTFLTGIEAIGNQPAKVTPSEQLRPDMGTPVTHANPNDVDRLGALGELLSGRAPEGYPNGRRLGDDAVDISVLAVAGVLCQPSTAATLGFPQCRTSNVNLGLGDGVDRNDKRFLASFPYVAPPTAPY